MGTLLFLGGAEIIVVLVAVLLLFGSKKLPEVARGLGKGMNEFRRAADDIKNEISKGASNIDDDIDDLKKSLK